MAAQQHKIMRQVLELRGCPPDAASHLQTVLRDSFYQRLLPMIEAACAELGSAGRLDRIDRLEIDLGRLPMARLDAAMGEQLQKRLNPELAAALRGAPPGDAALELFSHFIATGCLPWWADRDDRGLLDRNLDELLVHRPQALREALQAAPAAPQVLRRLALRYPDRLLGRLAASLAPALSAAGPLAWGWWLPLIQGVALAHGQTAHAARQSWWEEVLRAAGSSAQAAQPAAALMRLILGRLAPRLGSDLSLLLAALRQAVQDSVALQGTTLPALIDGLWRDAGGGVPAAQGHSAPELDSLRHALAQWQLRLAPHGGLWVRLGEGLDRLPAALLGRAAGAWHAMPAGHDASDAWLAALAALLRAALAQGQLPAALLERHAAGLLRAPPPQLSAAHCTALCARLREVLAARQDEIDTPEIKGRPGCSDADDLQLGNAGLVMLWPFLATFFKRLGLTEDARFVTAAAAQRGIGLLQFLASGDEQPLEPQLPLNKLLCGLAPETVFDFGVPITPAEAEECDDLLGAVIQQAPILHGLSLAGLRGSFLLRSGQLSARDGHWLLQVERQTHDIVLDRLPWGASIVSLPWMPVLLQVEW